jgi:predicted Zn finger-like uncharacterized protein
MKIVCDACQAKYSIADEKIQGKAFKIRCKKCSHIIVVKTVGEGAAAAVAEKQKAAAASDAVAPETDQGGWHVVIDGEQVGPLTEAEVKDRLRQGKINAETLVWKEGFADWTALSAVSDLTALLARITQHPAKPVAKEPAQTSGSSRSSGSMKAAVAPAATAEADPFGAATVITPPGTADLFASATAQAVPATVAPAPSSPFLFGGASSQATEPMVVIKSTGSGTSSTHLTGQRNENSVLFSLSNLEALAVPSHSSAIRAPSTTANTEGSGLIDIRSMAAMTLNDGGTSESRRSTDALPTFSTPQFSPVAPVLLPMSSSGPPKWVYPVLGLLAVGILVLGYGIYKVAAVPPPGLAPVVVAPPPPATPAPQPSAPQPSATQPVAANPAPTPAGENVKPAVVEEKPSVEAKSPEKSKGSSAKGDKGHRKGSESASNKGATESKKGDTSSPKSGASTPEPSTASSKPTGKKGGGKGLDDLLGEVGGKRGNDESPKPAAPAVKLITLGQSDIVNAMKAVQPKVQACANQFKVPGTALATISVATGGKVNSATVTGKFAGSPTGSCVESAAKSAKFTPCQSMTFPWPFTLTPR